MAALRARTLSRVMRPVARACAAAALMMFATQTPSDAFTPVLSAADISQAVREGTAMVGARVSASTGPPALRLGGKPGSVVAISVVTPYERLRYRIFLLVSRGEIVSDTVVARLVEQVQYRVDFVVRAHSRDAGDPAFLTRFGPATLVSNAASIRAAPMGRIDPAAAPKPGLPGETLDGRAIYRFDFTALAARGVPVDRLAGTLDFVDSAGVRHTVGVDLARYR